MRIRFVQRIIDIIRLKCFKIWLKEYLNQRPLVLKFILNIFCLFNSRDFILSARASILRFCGAQIGKNVSIGNDVYIYQPKNLIFEDDSGIGDNTVMRCWNKIHIGKYTFFAINSVFIPGSHRTDNYEDLQNQEIYIGPGCWFGANCTIMGGGKVHKGCVVGAGTVLLGKEYPPFSIIAGVPGKVIKKRTPRNPIKLPIEYNIEELQDYE